MNPDKIPPFTPEMIEQGYVLLGRGGTFKVPGCVFESRVVVDGGSSWIPWSVCSGDRMDVIYAAPANSEVARINGHGAVKESSTTGNAFAHFQGGEFDRLIDEIARLREENDRLKSERDNWRLSSVCREKQAEIDRLREENEQLKNDALSAEFRLKQRQQENIQHEEDYLAVWRLIKQPNETVVEACKRIIRANRELRESLVQMRRCFGRDSAECQQDIQAIELADKTLAKHKP